MKATIYNIDETTTVIESETMEELLGKVDINVVSRIDFGDKCPPPTCVTLKGLNLLILKALITVFETMAPDTCVRNISLRRIAHNVAIYITAAVKGDRHDEEKETG